MKLSDQHLEKADEQLLEALRNAEENQVLRTVMLLGSASNGVRRGEDAARVEPNDFDSHEDYRRALIQQQRERVEGEIAGAIQELRDLSLDVQGGKLSRSVVAEGPAAQILRSLDLPCVRHAALDQPISLIRPQARRAFAR